MADKSRIYKSSDWTVWVYKPTPGAFLLNFSKLDGPDVLDLLVPSMAEISTIDPDAKLAGLQIVESSSVTSSIFPELTPSTATITLQSTNNLQNVFYPNIDIQIKLKNEQVKPTQRHGFRTVMFSGKIVSIQQNYDPVSKFSTVTINAASHFASTSNFPLSITTNPDLTKGGKIANALGAIGSDLYSGAGIDTYDDNYYFVNAGSLNQTFGELLQDFNNCEMNVMADFPNVSDVDNTTYPLYHFVNYEERVVNFYSNSPGTPVKDFTSDDVFEIEMGWQGQDAPTGVVLSNTASSPVTYSYGASATASGGYSYTYSATLNVSTLDQLTAIGQKMLSMNSTWVPTSISVITATENQTVYYDERTYFYLTNAWLYPKELFFVGQTISTTIPEIDLPTTKSIIVGRTIDVTPDNWKTTYELWKGFTN